MTESAPASETSGIDEPCMSAGDVSEDPDACNNNTNDTDTWLTIRYSGQDIDNDEKPIYAEAQDLGTEIARTETPGVELSEEKSPVAEDPDPEHTENINDSNFIKTEEAEKYDDLSDKIETSVNDDTSSVIEETGTFNEAVSTKTGDLTETVENAEKSTKTSGSEKPDHPDVPDEETGTVDTETVAAETYRDEKVDKNEENGPDRSDITGKEHVVPEEQGSLSTSDELVKSDEIVDACVEDSKDPDIQTGYIDGPKNLVDPDQTQSNASGDTENALLTKEPECAKPDAGPGNDKSGLVLQDDSRDPVVATDPEDAITEFTTTESSHGKPDTFQTIIDIIKASNGNSKQYDRLDNNLDAKQKKDDIASDD